MAIENTAKREAMVHLIGAMSDGPSQYIENMERDGQNQIVHSDRLPTRINTWSATDKDFITLGFAFGDVDTRDPLFRPATLPTGWTRRASDHAMWSYISDERGIDRVSIFYKAAFYDRDAFMNLLDVGCEACMKIVYGDEPVEGMAISWDLMTDGERLSFMQKLEAEASDKISDYSRPYVERATKALDIYRAKAAAS